MLRSVALALLFATTSLAPLIAQQPVETMLVNADRVNLRVAPSIDSAIVRSLSKGTTVTVLARDNGWVKVQAATRSGWVRANLLTATAATAAVPPSASSNAPPAAAAPMNAAAPPPVSAPPSAPAAPSSQPPVAVAPRPNARSADRVGTQLELTIGISTETMTESGDPWTHGIRGGIGVILPLGAHVGFMPEVLLTRTHQAFGYFADTLTEHNLYGEVSLLLRPRIGSRRSSLILMLGPTVKYLVNCGYSDSNGASGSGCLATGVQRLDGAITIGAGVTLGPLLVQARALFYLRDYDSDSNHSDRNTALFLGAGLVF